jgi:TorA maturation chaperone TorD
VTSTASPTAERAELIRSLGALCERPGPTTARIAEALGLPSPNAVDHTDLFVQQMPPYASIYLDTSGKIGGDAQDRIAGFWRAMQMVPPTEPDHLATILGLWAAVVEKAATESRPERRSLLDHSQRTLAWEHLASWLTPYLTRVIEVSEVFADWGRLLGAVIGETLADSEVLDLPGHLAMAQPELAGHDDLVSYLLTPIRSGILLTRADLNRAAAELSLGIRLGERSFSLKSLLEQERRSVIEWVAAEAARQARLFSSGIFADTIAAVWSERADQTHTSLLALARVR